MQRIEAVQAVRVTATTGSVVLRYDPEAISAELLVVAIIKLLDLAGDMDNVPSSLVAATVFAAGRPSPARATCAGP